MNNCLEIQKLEKKYEDFSLKDVGFHVPMGQITGLVGRNGAGKTTCIRQILGLSEPDEGTILFWNQSCEDTGTELFEKIGVVLDHCCFPKEITVQKLSNILKRSYRRWNQNQFEDYIRRFQIPEQKKMSEFSKGMSTNLSIAVALSHNPSLLIFDEATSGLDPVLREEIMDLLLEFVQDETRAVLIRSHISSDLEKIADRIILIEDGKVLLETLTDVILNDFGKVSCRKEDLSFFDSNQILGCREMDYSLEMLVKDRKKISQKLPYALVEKPGLDDLLLLYGKGVSF